MLTREHLIQADRSRLATVEIGDSKQPTFFPQVKTLHWKNECNFSVRLSDPDYASGIVTIQDNVVQWERGQRRARMYRQGSDDEDGTFEFDVTLLSRPADNHLDFTLQHKGLLAFYQPPLTLEEVVEGAQRPDNIVGSYYFRHTTKAWNLNDRDGTPIVHYRAGKAFHMYRPHATDAAGLRVWCDLHVDMAGNRARITIPQAFLDAAVYPVVVDPTFGYTSIGASTQSTSNASRFYATEFMSPADMGTVTAITAYIDSDPTGGSRAVGTAIYDASEAKVAEDTGNGTATATAAWVATTFNTALSPSTAYQLIPWINAVFGATINWDTGDTDQAYLDNAAKTFETWPATATRSTNQARKYSIYADYTASGGTTFESDVSGTLSFSGAVSRNTLKSISGTSSFAGTRPTMFISSGKAGTLTFVGGHTKSTAKSSFQGTLSFVVGNIVKTSIKNLGVATLDFLGSVSRAASKILPAASLSSSGTALKNTSKNVSSNLDFVGAVANFSSKTVTSTLTFVGNLTRTRLLSLAGILSFSGAVVRQRAKLFTGAVSFIGSTTKNTSKGVGSALSFVGAFTKAARKIFTGTLVPAGEMLGFNDFGEIFNFRFDNYPTKTTYRFQVKMRVISGAIEARLVDDLDESVVSGSELYTTSTSYVVMVSPALTLLDGHDYKIQFGSSIEGAFRYAKIRAS